MATLAVCGDTVAITGDFAGIGAHTITIDVTSNEQDVRAFGDTGGFGSWLACSKAGAITIQSYAAYAGDVGDTGTLAASIGGVDVSFPVVVTGLNTSVDAKGVIEHSTSLRVTSA